MKTKHISWIKITLVFMTMRFGNALSAISTYLKLHIWINIHWITLTFVNCSSRTQLLAIQVKYPDNYVNLQLDDNIDDVICYKKDPAQPNSKIALPKSMVVDTIKWFHQVMGHPDPGEKKLHEALNQCYHHLKLCYHNDRLKCNDCQKYKLAGRVHSLLPKWEVRNVPWEEVTINLIGLWKVKVNGQ